MSLDRELALFSSMLLIRRCEERLSRLFADGEVPGFLHLSLGQEAVAVGVCSALGPADTLASTHRGHGHALAKGVNLDGFFAELMGRETGLCMGRGGSIHVAEMGVGMLGANGIVGGGLSLALGSAWAHQVRGDQAVALAFFGDGALAEGVIHECLNIAALWKLPLIFVCENNGWSEFSPQSISLATQPQKLAAAFDIRYELADGLDVNQVAQKAQASVQHAREGAGPVMLECLTQRWRGHYEGDPQKYRPADDLAAARGKDPIERHSAALLAQDAGLAARIQQIEEAVLRRIDEAVERARLAPEPQVEGFGAGVYAQGGLHA